MGENSRFALFLLAFIAWFVAISYLFALTERRNVIGECFERASGEQVAICRAIPRNPAFFDR